MNHLPNPVIQEKLQNFFQKFPIQTYSKDHVLLRSGSVEKYIYYIESGAVKMTTTSKDGENLVLSIFYPGSFLSMFFLIDEGKNAYDYSTVIDCQLRKIPLPEFLKFLQENNDVLFELHTRLLRGVQGLLRRIEQTHFVPAYNQVAGLLLYFARHFGERIRVHITHQEISEWLGLSRENVSIQMKKLERDGLIRKNDSLIELLDVEKLTQLSDPHS